MAEEGSVAGETPTAQQAPWLAPQIEQLQRARAAGRFPAALLIHDGRGAARGAGGEALARFAAQLALCREPAAPCGQCRDCRRVQSGSHPDLFVLSPLEDSKLIRVEQVRELAEQLSLTSHGGGAMVGLISPADSMNANAANALLKTLEEPHPGVTLILVCAVPSQLPATVLSRCQRVRVPSPPRAVSVAWLERYRGSGPWAAALDVLGEAPFEALAVDATEIARLKAETDHALSEASAGRLDIPGSAERWGRGEGFELRLACIENWLTTRIDRAVDSASRSPELRSSSRISSTHLPESGSDMNIALLLRLLDGIHELRHLRLTSINRSLALEQLLWQLARASRAPTQSVSA
jgi:DNA polymerase-3 subunit delta'